MRHHVYAAVILQARPFSITPEPYLKRVVTSPPPSQASPAPPVRLGNSALLGSSTCTGGGSTCTTCTAVQAERLLLPHHWAPGCSGGIDASASMYAPGSTACAGTSGYTGGFVPPNASGAVGYVAEVLGNVPVNHLLLKGQHRGFNNWGGQLEEERGEDRPEDQDIAFLEISSTTNVFGSPAAPAALVVPAVVVDSTSTVLADDKSSTLVLGAAAAVGAAGSNGGPADSDQQQQQQQHPDAHHQFDFERHLQLLQDTWQHAAA